MESTKIKNLNVHAAFFMDGLAANDLSVLVQKWNPFSGGNGGRVEVVSELMEYVPLLSLMEDIAAEASGSIDNGYPGVIEYEVAVPFGKWFGQHLIDHADIPDRDVAVNHLADMVCRFFSSGYDPSDKKNKDGYSSGTYALLAAKIREAVVAQKIAQKLIGAGFSELSPKQQEAILSSLEPKNTALRAEVETCLNDLADDHGTSKPMRM